MNREKAIKMTLANSWRAEQEYDIDEAISELQAWKNPDRRGYHHLDRAKRKIADAQRLEAFCLKLEGNSLLAYIEEQVQEAEG